MLSEYKFAPPGTKPLTLPTSFQSDAPPVPVPSGSSGEIVKMEAFEVRESTLSIAAFDSPGRKSSNKPPATVAGKLGIGEHDFEVGKLHAFVITIFYVPFVAGFSW